MDKMPQRVVAGFRAKEAITEGHFKRAYRNENKFESLEEALQFLRKFDGKYFTEFFLTTKQVNYRTVWVFQYTYEKQG